MPFQFTRALIFTIGQALDGDGYIDAFRDATTREAWDCPHCRTVKEALGRLQGSGNESLVLFATVGMMDTALETALSAIAQTGATILVYANSRHEGLGLAIRCSKYCADYVLEGRTAAKRLGDRVTALNLKRKLYTQIPLKNMQHKRVRLTRGSTVFIATPFSAGHRAGLQVGAEAALRGLDLEPQWGDDVSPTCTTIFEKAAFILKAKLLIANVVEDDPARSRHNPNVYFEAGLAGGRGIPILFVRPKAENGTTNVPSEIQGIHIHEYETSLDLALTLYHGLKDSVV